MNRPYRLDSKATECWEEGLFSFSEKVAISSRADAFVFATVRYYPNGHVRVCLEGWSEREMVQALLKSYCKIRLGLLRRRGELQLMPSLLKLSRGEG